MDTFARCSAINAHLAEGLEIQARDELIQLLADFSASEAEQESGYGPLINHLVRETGLFPYIDAEDADWQERFVREAFKVDVGLDESVTLHREQYKLLDALLSGRSIAVSAPTSFGKSFVIDAFIAIRQPNTVVILVPTIALADETRRRLQGKFGDSYRLITTSELQPADRTIFVFPQERASAYADAIGEIDLLIVDEFYKASKVFDKERAPALVRAIAELGPKARQKYFLAPHVAKVADGGFMEGVEFMLLDFNTVYLKKHDLYQAIGKDEAKKSSELLRILQSVPGKTLIYAGGFANITKLGTLLIDSIPSRATTEDSLLGDFSAWLSKNYDPNWQLTHLVRKGIGVHNGQLHRSVGQIQIKLFEEADGLNQIISTSSIIEGVNTSARNVVLWSNKNGNAKLTDFSYRNILGRGGRMFRHFVGEIFILEPPPAEESTELDLPYPDELVGTIDEEALGIELTSDQWELRNEYARTMRTLVGSQGFDSLRRPGYLQNNDNGLTLSIARELKQNTATWRGLMYLNSPDPGNWDRMLYRLLRLRAGGWDTEYTTFVEFTKVLSGNWLMSIPQLLEQLDRLDVGIDTFFKLERNVSYKLSALLGDVAKIYNEINQDQPIDVSLPVSRMSHAFLPPVVANLEEYGLPRMVAKKVCQSSLIDLENLEANLLDVLDEFRDIGLRGILGGTVGLDRFDEYIIRHFFEGIGGRKRELARQITPSPSAL